MGFRKYPEESKHHGSVQRVIKHSEGNQAGAIDHSKSGGELPPDMDEDKYTQLVLLGENRTPKQEKEFREMQEKIDTYRAEIDGTLYAGYSE